MSSNHASSWLHHTASLISPQQFGVLDVSAQWILQEGTRGTLLKQSLLKGIHAVVHKKSDGSSFGKLKKRELEREVYASLLLHAWSVTAWSRVEVKPRSIRQTLIYRPGSFQNKTALLINHMSPGTQKRAAWGHSAFTPTDWASTVFSTGCCLHHRPILLRSDKTALFPSLSSPHPLPFPLSHSLGSAGSTAWSLILFPLCCSARLPRLPGTVFLVVLHLASQRDVKPKASLHFSRILPASSVLCFSVLRSLHLCPLLLSFYPSFSLHLVFPFSSHWFSSFTCSLPHTLALISPPSSFFSSSSLSPSLFISHAFLLFELKCCKSEIRL